MARPLVPLALLAAALTAAGCGASAKAAHQHPKPATLKTANLVELAAKSASKTRKAGSAHVTIAMSMHVAGSPTQRFSIAGGGDISYKPLRERLSLTFHSPVPQLSGTMREVMTGARLYMSWPLLTAQTPGHKTWVKENLATIGSATGMNVTGMINQGGSGNPSEMLSYLRSVSSLTRVGSATIDGVATTHYSGTIDYSRLVARKQISQKMLDTVRTELGKTTVPFQLWIDGHHLVRQLSESLSLTTPNGPTMVMSMRFGFSRFGERVHIQTPPASQVYDAGKLAASQAG